MKRRTNFQCPARTGRGRFPGRSRSRESVTLKTLADVRELMRHLPDAHRQRSTWRHVEALVADAARGGDINDAVVALRFVLSMEGVECRNESSGKVRFARHG
jgi:hypothetical protein